MEIRHHSFQFEEKIKLDSKGIIFFLSAMFISLWWNVMVSASPPSTLDIGKDYRTPLSERVFDSSREWRIPKKKKKLWRKSKEDKLKPEKGRIKKKSFSIYNPIIEKKDWDPHSLLDKQRAFTKPATVFKFEF